MNAIVVPIMQNGEGAEEEEKESMEFEVNFVVKILQKFDNHYIYLT